MQSFTSFFTERFVNLRDVSEQKRAIAERVYDMIQQAYAKIGGVHGTGFRSPEDMVLHIPFWKVYRYQGEVRAVLMYKMKNGRKIVTMATDGTPEGRRGLAKMMRDDVLLGRSYAEISGPALVFLKRQLPDRDLSALAVPLDRVRKALSGDDIREAPDDDPEVVKHPELRDFFYQRQIGATGDATWHTKVMVGNPQ